jgi:hypothetical protein
MFDIRIGPGRRHVQSELSREQREKSSRGRARLGARGGRTAERSRGAKRQGQYGKRSKPKMSGMYRESNRDQTHEAQQCQIKGWVGPALQPGTARRSAGQLGRGRQRGSQAKTQKDWCGVDCAEPPISLEAPSAMDARAPGGKFEFWGAHAAASRRRRCRVRAAPRHEPKG